MGDREADKLIYRSKKKNWGAEVGRACGRGKVKKELEKSEPQGNNKRRKRITAQDRVR